MELKCGREREREGGHLIVTGFSWDLSLIKAHQITVLYFVLCRTKGIWENKNTDKQPRDTNSTNWALTKICDPTLSSETKMTSLSAMEYIRKNLHHIDFFMFAK